MTSQSQITALRSSEEFPGLIPSLVIFLLTGGEITSDLTVPFFVGTCIFKVGLLRRLDQVG